MANYNLYKNIDPGSLKSAASSLSQKLKTSQSKLSTFDSSLSDGIWKANAKATLKEAFGKIDSEVYKSLLDDLGKAETIAGLIEKYNAARSKAETYNSYLSSATKETPQSSIDEWQRNKLAEEQIMDDCESQINGLL